MRCPNCQEEFDFLSVGEVAQLLKVRPQQITALFYCNKLRNDICPVVGRTHRIIPRSYVEVIAQRLRSDKANKEEFV